MEPVIDISSQVRLSTPFRLMPPIHSSDSSNVLVRASSLGLKKGEGYLNTHWLTERDIKLGAVVVNLLFLLLLDHFSLIF